MIDREDLDVRLLDFEVAISDVAEAVKILAENATALGGVERNEVLALLRHADQTLDLELFDQD